MVINFLCGCCHRVEVGLFPTFQRIILPLTSGTAPKSRSTSRLHDIHVVCSSVYACTLLMLEGWLHLQNLSHLIKMCVLALINIDWHFEVWGAYQECPWNGAQYFNITAVTPTGDRPQHLLQVRICFKQVLTKTTAYLLSPSFCFVGLHVSQCFLPHFLRPSFSSQSVTNLFHFLSEQVLRSLSHALPHFSADRRICCSDWYAIAFSHQLSEDYIVSLPYIPKYPLILRWLTSEL
jgi:hypothetical protein